MAFLQIGIVVAFVVGAFVVGAALDRGFPIEVAIVRGVVAFMAVSFAGYVGDLVVVTAPRRDRSRARRAPPAPQAEQRSEPQTPRSAPQLTVPAQRASDNVGQDDAEAGLRPAA